MIENNLNAISNILANMECIDLSPTIESGMPKWITHPQIIVDPTITHEHDGYYCQTLVLGEHSGAHVDSPAHVFADRMDQTIDTFPPNVIMGQAIVYQLEKFNPQPGQRVTLDQLLQLEEEMQDSASEGDIVLLKYGWQKYWKMEDDWKYYSINEPGLTEEAARHFLDKKVKAVGSDTTACDTPCVNGAQEYTYGHNLWLPNNILIMEMIHNLDLLPTRCYFMAIPLKIKNGSGSPIRPIAFIDR